MYINSAYIYFWLMRSYIKKQIDVFGIKVQEGLHNSTYRYTHIPQTSAFSTYFCFLSALFLRSLWVSDHCNPTRKQNSVSVHVPGGKVPRHNHHQCTESCSAPLRRSGRVRQGTSDSAVLTPPPLPGAPPSRTHEPGNNGV